MTTLLLVESDKSALRALHRLLERAGYRVCVATTVEEACRLAREHSCALALVDLSAPGVAGVSICRALREQASTPVLVLSTGAVPGERAAALDAGALAFLVKPVPADRLLASLASICPERKRPTPPRIGDMG